MLGNIVKRFEWPLVRKRCMNAVLYHNMSKTRSPQWGLGLALHPVGVVFPRDPEAVVPCGLQCSRVLDQQVEVHLEVHCGFPVQLHHCIDK